MVKSINSQMIKKLKLLLILFFFYIFTTPALAGFGVSPADISNNHLKPGDNFEKEITLSRSDINEDLKVTIETDLKEAEDWFQFEPVIKSEINYRINPPKIDTDIIPVDQNFSLVIPKINANTRVIVNVDPFSSQIYQQALTLGVAHASTSDTPDKSGNVFIFAHSAGNWYQANQYNAVFYLLNKLKRDDKIFVYYKNKKYSYSVTEVKTVNSQQTNITES